MAGKVMLVAALAVVAAACRSEQKPAPTGRASAATSTWPAPSIAAAPSAAASAPSAPHAAPPEALVKVLDAWNAATNAGDAKGLEAVYAKSLSLYERIVTRSEAVRRKRDYVARHPTFSQTLDAVTWQAVGDRHAVRFRKTSSSQGVAPSSVDAYLVFKQADGAWLIVDEGDVQTMRKISSGVDAQRQSWKPCTWLCAGCNDPEYGDDPPNAGPPLGPDTVKASAPIPPGAPAVVEYGRAYFPRFASGVDVPLFLSATPQSTNGDGRWFFYDDPRPEMRQLDAEGLPKHLLYCTIGGHFMVGPLPANARPDPGHAGQPQISYTTLFERRAGELYYERYIYGSDGVMNYVYCTFAPAYEAYFYAIVQRMGRSMRALGGGQSERVERVSQPFTVD